MHMGIENVILDYEHKIELAEWIAKSNRGAVTGSIMLKERGVELEREINDIDIVISENIKDDAIIVPPFSKEITNVSDEYGYESPIKYKFGNVKIDFIKDNDALKKADNYYGRGVLYCQVNDALEAKRKYIEQNKQEIIKSNKISDFLIKTLNDISVIKRYNKEFPIVLYSVSNQGVIVKYVCESKMGDKYAFSIYNLMACDMFDEWKLTNPINAEKSCLVEIKRKQTDGKWGELYQDFSYACNLSKERWDKEVNPNGRYRVAKYFDDMFDGYVTPVLSKKDTYEIMRKSNLNANYLSRYEIEDIDKREKD